MAEQYRQQTLTEQDNGEKLKERCKTIINSTAEEMLCIMEPENKEHGLMLNARLPHHKKTNKQTNQPTNQPTNPYRQMQHGTRSLIEGYKDKRRKEKTIHKRKTKEWMNVELGNMEMLRKQHECRKFYKEINMARNQFMPRVNTCRNEDGSLISTEQEILNRGVRHFDKLLNGRKNNEGVTFTTISRNQILKGKTQDITDAPTTKETETALKKLKTIKLLGQTIFKLNY